jgi:hypothetical protein
MPHTTFANEYTIINNGREQLVTAQDGEKRIYVAVAANGFTDYPIAIRIGNGYSILWDRPEAFTARFKRNVFAWMQSNPNPNN